MPGDHAAPGLKRFYRELSSSLIRWLIVAAVIIAVAWGIARLFESLGESGTTTTSVPITQTSVPVSSTTTTSAPTTTTTASTTTTSTTITTTTTIPPELLPSEVEVVVLNSTTVSGLAAGVSDNLAVIGYQMLEPDNYRPTLDTSRIWFADGFDDEAITLASQIPQQTVIVEPWPNEDPIPADIVVVLGTDFGG